MFSDTSTRRRRAYDSILASMQRPEDVSAANAPRVDYRDAALAGPDPWSERTPDGRTVNELIMDTLRRQRNSPVSTTSPDSDSVTPTIRKEQPLPAPGLLGEDDPQMNAGRPWKAGYGVGETDPLKREAARIRAMIENPTSQVSSTGAVDAPKPMGRLNASLLGALFGLAQGDRNTSLAERLAAGGAGAAVGGFKPRAIQDWRRRMEVDDTQSQLAQQMKLATGQSQLDNLRAETESRRAETESRLADLMLDPQTGRLVKRPPRRPPQYVEREDGVYEISEDHPNGRRVGNIPAEVKKAASRRPVHYENRPDGLYAVYEGEDGQIKSQRVEGVPGRPLFKPDPPKSDTRGLTAYQQTRRQDAAKALVAKIKSARIEAERLTQKANAELERSKDSTKPNYSSYYLDERDRVLKEGTDAAIELNEKFGDQYEAGPGDGGWPYWKEKPQAQQTQPQPQGQQTQEPDYRGKRWSKSQWAAKYPNGDLDAAIRQAKGKGAIVVE